MLIDKKNKGRFVLKVHGRYTQYFQMAGIHIDENGESEPHAATTPYFREAMRFPTFRRTTNMRNVLKERYGLKTHIVDVDDIERWRRRYARVD